MGSAPRVPPRGKFLHDLTEAVVRQAKWSLKRPFVVSVSSEHHDDYLRARAREFRSQIGVIANISVTAMILQGIFAWLFPSIATPVPFFMLIIAIAAEILTWLISRRITHLVTIQFLALFTFLIPLSMLVRVSALDNSYYLVIIFVVGFILPWNGVEAAIVSSLPILGFFIVRGKMRDLIGTANDFFIFFISTIIITSLQLKQERERRIAFMVESEAEEARRSLMESLRLASKLHSEIISHSDDFDGLSARVVYESMQYLGGDYVKIAALGDGRTSMMLADVTGHGAPAALMVNRVNTQVEYIMAARRAPGKGAAELNNFVTKTFEGTAMLMSALWTEYDARKNIIKWSNYGHPPPIYLEKQTRTARLLSSNAYVMGINIPQQSPENTLDVAAGDLILFYTDGLIEITTETGHFDLWSLLAHVESLLTSTENLTADSLLADIGHLVRSRHVGEVKDDLLVIAWEIKGK